MSVERAVAKKPPRQTVAAAISTIVHPVALPLLTLAVITYTAIGSLQRSLMIAAVALLLVSAPVAALVSFQVLRGRWTDLDVSVRQQRYILYPVGMICGVLMVVALVAIGAPTAAIATTLALALANGVDGLINFAYKVSAHAATAAACAGLLWLHTANWGPPVALAAALVGWSRVELGRHTTGQVILGWVVGLGSALTVFALYA